LLLRCSFLWDDGDYRIVDSHGASITVASADVRLRFTCRGAGVAIDVERVRSGPVSSRFSLSRLCALLGRFDGGDDADLCARRSPTSRRSFAASSQPISAAIGATCVS